MNEIRRNRIKESALNTENPNNNSISKKNAAVYKRSKSLAAPHTHKRTGSLQQQEEEDDATTKEQLRHKRSNSASGQLIRSQLSFASFSTPISIKQIPIDDDVGDDELTTMTKGSASDEEPSTTTSALAKAIKLERFESIRSRSQSLVPSAEILQRVSYLHMSILLSVIFY